MRTLRLFPFLLLFGCSSDPIPAGHYVLTTGQESDTYTMSPTPVIFESSSVDANGNKTVIETSDTPIGSIDVGNTGSNFFLVKGEDTQGVRRVQATSYMMDAITLAGYDMPLFIGRTDAFCRPPTAVAAQGEHPPVGVFWGQLIWMAGASSDNSIVSDGYDLVGWTETAPPSFLATCPTGVTPCPFRSIANYAGQYGLAIGSDWAMSIDIQLQTTQTQPPPSTLPSWAEVSGGRTLNALIGNAFIVGPTRTDSASSFVVELATDGNMTALPLTTARQNAAATYIDGQGLLVVGGSADANGAGAEFLSETGTTFTSLPYPADPVVGAALVAETTGTRVWRVGGKMPDQSNAPTVVYDVACAGDPGSCTPQAQPAFDLAVTNAQGFSFNGSRIVIGELDDGTMVAWRLTDTDPAPVPVPLREPRRSATVYSLPNGFAALIGGTLISDNTQAKSLELLAY